NSCRYDPELHGGHSYRQRPTAADPDVRDAPAPQPDREQHDRNEEIEQRQRTNQHAFVRGENSPVAKSPGLTNSSPVRPAGDPTPITLPIWSSASSSGRAGTLRARCGTKSQSGSNR